MKKYDFLERNKLEKEAGSRIESEGQATNIKKKFIRELADNARKSAVKQYAWDILGQEGFDFNSLSIRQSVQILQDLNNNSVIETTLDSAAQEQKVSELNTAVLTTGLKKTMDYMDIRRKDILHKMPDKNRIKRMETLMAMKKVIEFSKGLVDEEAFDRLAKDYENIIVPDMKAAPEEEKINAENSRPEPAVAKPKPIKPQPVERGEEEEEGLIISQGTENFRGERKKTKVKPQVNPTPVLTDEDDKRKDEDKARLWQKLERIGDIKTAEDLEAYKDALQELESQNLSEVEKARIQLYKNALKNIEKELSKPEEQILPPEIEEEKIEPEVEPEVKPEVEPEIEPEEEQEVDPVIEPEVEPVVEPEEEPVIDPEDEKLLERKLFCPTFEKNCLLNKTSDQKHALPAPVCYTRTNDENEPQTVVYKLYDNEMKKNNDEPHGILKVHDEKNVTLESEEMKDFILLAKIARQCGHKTITIGKLSEDAKEAKEFAARLVIAAAIEGLKVRNAPALEDLKEVNPRIALLIEKQKIREEMAALRRQLKEAQASGAPNALGAAQKAFAAKMNEALNHHVEKGSIDYRKDGESQMDSINRLKDIVNNPNTDSKERVSIDENGNESKESPKDFMDRRNRVAFNRILMHNMVKDR